MKSVPALTFALLVASLGCGACSKAPKNNVEGATLFANSCARCHGATGAGGVATPDGGPAPRNFRDHAFQASRSDADVRLTIVNGKGTAMPAFGALFSDAQLDALVRQVRSFDEGGRP